MTPVEELRAAATKLREKAKGTTDGPWFIGDCELYPRWILSQSAIDPRDSHHPAYVAKSYADGGGDGLEVSDADWKWMAFASPLLAEPLAAWLDAAAEEVCTLGGADRTEAELAAYACMVPTWPAALATARAILRGSS